MDFYQHGFFLVPKNRSIGGVPVFCSINTFLQALKSMFNFNHRILHILRTLHFVEKFGINILYQKFSQLCQFWCMKS